MSRLHRGRKQLRERLTEYAKELGYNVKAKPLAKKADPDEGADS
jgi:RNA polymerase sigma-70 factor (ECF subfamily)